MASFVFVHAADLHLDTPFEGLSRAQPAVADALRDASLAAWDKLVALTISRRAAFLLIGGDVYDGADRGVRAQLRFLRGLERLAKEQIPVFVVHGNHDPLDGWSAIRDWPTGVTVFGAQGVASKSVTLGGETIATVHGISYPVRDVRDNLSRLFRRTEAPGIHIGLLHTNVGEHPEHAAYAPCTLDDLRAAGMDYWALGHIHSRQILTKSPWVVYPGNLQGRSPNYAELGPKGAVVVSVESGVIRDVAFEAVDAVRFIAFDQAIDDLPDLNALRKVLADRIPSLRAEHPGRGLVLRGTLRGRSSLYRDIRHADSIVGLVRELREECEHLRPFVFWERLLDRTRPPLDRATIIARGDFPAELLKHGKELRADSATLARMLEGPRRSAGSAIAGQRLVASSETEALEILEEAEDLALDLLEGDLPA